MGIEIENPAEFLDGAKAAVAYYSSTKEKLEAQKDLEEKASRALEQFRQDTEELTAKTLKTRYEGIASVYDQQLTQIDQRLKKAVASREKARGEGVKGRISAETNGLITENKELRRKMTAVLKKDHAPLFCNTGAFYVLFRPSGVGELLIDILMFLLFFGVLPLGIFWFLPQRKTLYLFIIYIVLILVIGGLFLFLNNISVGKHRDAIQEARSIRSTIRKNRKKIQSIIRTVKSDSNDSVYNLGEFDDEIAKIQQERNDIISQKQSEQNTFDTVTRNIITDEIQAAAKPRLDELDTALREASALRSSLEQQEKESALNLSNTYSTYLGKAHLNDADIEQIRTMLTSGEATSIIDAVTRLDHPDKQLS